MAENVKLTGMDETLRMLHELPAEVVSKRGGPAKSALRKGANVILREAKLNLARVTNDLEADGEQSSTGLLQKNLIVSRGKPPSDGKGERYLVRVRRKGYGRPDASTLKSAQLLEYGSGKQPAEPWLRPAFNARAREAIGVVTSDLARSIDRLVKRYLKGGR